MSEKQCPDLVPLTTGRHRDAVGVEHEAHRVTRRAGPTPPGRSASTVDSFELHDQPDVLAPVHRRHDLARHSFGGHTQRVRP